MADMNLKGTPYTIYDSEKSTKYVADTDTQWNDQYKDAFLEQSHDFSELSLILPDDCLVLVGPPRYPFWNVSNATKALGFLQGVTISQTSAVQPLKAIGSRRHIMAKTNQPVSVQINRMMFTSGTLLGSLYSVISSSTGHINDNQTYKAGTISTLSDIKNGKGEMYTNLEDDLYRIPFGLRIFLGSPTIVANETTKPSILIEGCTLQAHTMSLNSGDAMVMEQVSIVADRVVGWERSSNRNVASNLSGH